MASEENTFKKKDEKSIQEGHTSKEADKRNGSVCLVRKFSNAFYQPDTSIFSYTLFG